jgi:hypothetical protein
MKKLIALLSLFAAFAFVAPAIAQGQSSADTNMQILRDKIRADKKAIVAENMDLTDAEAKVFWPLYDSYQKELEVLNKRTLDVIVEYANAWNEKKLTDQLASKLIKETIAIEQAEAAMRKREAAKLLKALPPRKAARYLQIESKIRAIVKYELASRIPLAE